MCTKTTTPTASSTSSQKIPCALASGGRKSASHKARDEITGRYLKRYTLAVDHFAKEQYGALHYGAIEQRLYDVYHTTPTGLAKLYRGDIKLRVQTGLADEFLAAAATAQTYLPTMEQIFASNGVPTRLTRLPFVESMFNVKARSKVGASGIWQFMPQTARNYIFVNRLVDERNAPEKATRAAAVFLRGNYRELGSWPLAITAYNHGKAGMANATRQLGTSDFATILNQYESPSFGFASRNFYAEFLAAAKVYDRLLRQHRIPPPETPVATSSIVLKQPISIAQLIRVTGLRREVIAQLNPCLLPHTLTTHANQMLPPFYEIKVPLTQARSIRLAIQAAQSKRYATR